MSTQAVATMWVTIGIFVLLGKGCSGCASDDHERRKSRPQITPSYLKRWNEKVAERKALEAAKAPAKVKAPAPVVAKVKAPVVEKAPFVPAVVKAEAPAVTRAKANEERALAKAKAVEERAAALAQEIELADRAIVVTPMF
jgi:hypothetical protein